MPERENVSMPLLFLIVITLHVTVRLETYPGITRGSAFVGTSQRFRSVRKALMQFCAPRP